MDYIVMTGIFIGSIITIILLFCMFMAYLEEKRKCKHKWKTINIIKGLNMMNTITTEYHLKCVRCGEIKQTR